MSMSMSKCPVQGSPPRRPVFGTRAYWFPTANRVRSFRDPSATDAIWNLDNIALCLMPAPTAIGEYGSALRTYAVLCRQALRQEL